MFIKPGFYLQSVIMCFARFSEQTATVSMNRIKQLVLVIQMYRILFEIGNEYLCII